MLRTTNLDGDRQARPPSFGGEQAVYCYRFNVSLGTPSFPIQPVPGEPSARISLQKGSSKRPFPSETATAWARLWSG
jgi:hypothetical protein